MFQYILILLAALAVIGIPSLDSLVSAGPAMDYVVAFGVALLLKPWLQGHLE
jgi:hypothetical protein